MMAIVIITTIMGLIFVACNTMEGMGKDVKGAGSSLEKAAAKKK